MNDVYLFWYRHPFVFLTKIFIYFMKINTDVDVYLNMLTSNPVRFKSSYAVVQCVALLVHTDVGCCEV